jgi:hypothetical protein
MFLSIKVFYPATGSVRRLGTFTTDDGPDLEKPLFGGTAKVTDTVDVCDSDACCGPYDGVRSFAEWPAATDNSAGPLLYRLHREDTGETTTIYVPLFARFVLCSGDMLGGGVGPVYARKGGRYSVRAVDLSGHESVDAISFVMAECGGDGDSVKADTGCAVGRGRSPWPAALVLLLGCLSYLAVRRRVVAKRMRVP